MKAIYYRCMDGHYFLGPPNGSTLCPFDGWSADVSKELASAVDTLLNQKQDLTIDRLRSEGVSEQVLSRTIIIDFGNEESAFEALIPHSYVVDGKRLKVSELGRAFK